MIRLALLSLSCAALASAQSPPSPPFADARQRIERWMAHDSVPGLAVAVSRDGKILWEQGFGWADRERGVRATEHTPFYTASISKTITATAMMHLVEARRLDLDRPVNAYLRTSALWSPRGDENLATVRRVASHTGGLSTFDLGCPPDRATCEAPAADEIIGRYGVLATRPGVGFDYSNLGYLVLGEVVARAAGRPLAVVLRDDVFRPLGMNHSSLGVDSAAAATAAARYGWTGRRATVPSPGGSGASSVYSSAHDLMMFGALHLGLHPNGGRVLSAASVGAMQTSTVPAGGASRYGLGWWVRERFGYETVLAQGGTQDSQAWLRLIPSEGIAVAVLANKGVGFPEEIVDAVIAELLPRYAELWSAAQSAPPTSPSAVASPPATPDSIRGEWSGAVRGPRLTLPIRLAFRDTGIVEMRVGTSDSTRTARLRPSSTTVRLHTAGRLEPEPSPVDLAQSDFWLRLIDGALRGYVTTSPPTTTGMMGSVTYWVELRRR